MLAKKLQSLGKDILWYGGGNILYSLVQLLAMSVLVRDMTMSEVAIWNILLPTGVLISAVVTLGMDSAIVRFIIDGDELHRKTIYSTGLLFVTGFTVLTSITLWILSSEFLKIIRVPSNHLVSYWILLWWLPGVILSQLSQQWLKYSFQHSRFISVVAMQSTIYLTAVLFLKITHRVDLQNVMLASSISIWFSALLGLYYSRNLILLTFDQGALAKMLLYGLPFMMLAFGYNLIFSVDKYLLVGDISNEDFAVYSQSFRVAAIFSMIVSSFNFAFGPFSLSLMHEEDASDIFATLRTIYLLVISFIGLVFISLDKVVLELLAGAKYVAGYTFIPFFVFGYILYGLYSFAQIGIVHSKTSHLGLFVLFCGLTVTIGFDLITIPSMKGYGTALGFTIGNLVMVLVAGSISKRYYKIKSNTLKDSLLFGVCMAIGLINPSLVTMDSIYVEGLLRSLVYLGLFSLLLCAPPFRVERTMFYDMLAGQFRNIRNRKI